MPPLTAVYTDPAGFNDIGDALFLVQTGTNGVNACYLRYNVQTNAFYLTDDAATYWQGPLTPGSQNFLQNNQCVLEGWASSASGSGTLLTVNFGLGLKAGFLAQKSTYMFAFNSAGGSPSGWYTVGSWSGGYPPSAPAPLFLIPGSGMGRSGPFTFNVQSYDGATYLSQVLMLFNTAINGNNACYIMYDRGGNAIYLTDDQSTYWMGGYAPGTPNTIIQNSQCSIDVGQTTVTSLFDTLTVRPMITFKNNLNGARNVYLYANDLYGQVSGWSQVGTWTVAASPLTINTPTVLPDAMANVPYNPVLFNATGGTPPYTWTVISGLPPGMSLTPDTLYGTPTAIIPPQLTVKVTDSQNQSVTKVFSLTVNGNSTVLVTASPSMRSIAPGASAGYTILVNRGYRIHGHRQLLCERIARGSDGRFFPKRERFRHDYFNDRHDREHASG